MSYNIDMDELVRLYNEDCISGCRRHIADCSVDLIITDPPYGIEGDKLHRHYNRKEGFVLDGYVEIPVNEYGSFSFAWIKEAERILKPGGSIYIVSGYSNLFHILSALRETSLYEINHIIWKYNFGVHTRNKFVSSHYHILYYARPGERPTFNRFCRFGPEEVDSAGLSLNYRDREDVWIINREYKPGRVKNKNELPSGLLKKIILYSSNEGDLVCDLFLGGFSTVRDALLLGRKVTGFEISVEAFEHGMKSVHNIQIGDGLKAIRESGSDLKINRYKSWSEEEKERLIKRYNELNRTIPTKRERIRILSGEFLRGRFAIEKILSGQ